MILAVSTIGIVAWKMTGPDWNVQPGLIIEDQCIYFFESDGCHSCAAADQYISGLEAEYPQLDVERFEIHNATNWALMVSLYQSRNITTYSAPPVVFIGNEVLIGEESIKSDLVPLLINNTGYECPSPNATLPPYDPGSSPPLGIIFSMAFADSLNPCAIAVLLILIMALSAAAGRVLLTGIAYIAGNFIVYVLIGYGLFTILSQFQLPYYTSKLIGVLAIVIAIYSLFSKIPVSQKPRVQKLIDRATSPPIAFLAGGVISAIELPCTGGPYFLATTLMSQYNLSQFEVLGYLLLYNLIFVSPLILILVLHVFSKTPKIPRDYIRYASAIAMWIIGNFLIIMI